MCAGAAGAAAGMIGNPCEVSNTTEMRLLYLKKYTGRPGAHVCRWSETCNLSIPIQQLL